jgi:glycosyltransferase involved in cell wall biosynthesis
VNAEVHWGTDVLLVVPSLEAGGAERVIVNLANGLARAGASPRVLVLERPDRAGLLADQLDGDVPLASLGHGRLRQAVPALLRHVRRQPPDVLVSTLVHVNLLLCASRRLLPDATTLVVREPIHAPDLLEGRSTRRRRRAQAWLYPRADLVLATSPAMVKDLRELTGAAVELLDNPVDVDAIRAAAFTTLADRAAGDVAAGTGSATVDVPRAPGRRFVSVGRLTRQKGHGALLQHFATAAGPADRLTIVGDGPLHDELVSLAAALGIADRVALVPTGPAHWRHVALADVLVLASEHEGMPNVVLEALALGVPVLAPSDLTVLHDLAAVAPEGTVRLVPRAALGAAMAATVPRVDGRGGLGTDLLPAAHRLGTVSSALLELIERHGRPRHPGGGRR